MPQHPPYRQKDPVEVSDAERIKALERRIATLENLVDKLQNALITAARFEHSDLATRVDGVLYLLKRAGEVKGRQKGRR